MRPHHLQARRKHRSYGESSASRLASKLKRCVNGSRCSRDLRAFWIRLETSRDQSTRRCRHAEELKHARTIGACACPGTVQAAAARSAGPGRACPTAEAPALTTASDAPPAGGATMPSQSRCRRLPASRLIPLSALCEEDPDNPAHRAPARRVAGTRRGHSPARHPAADRRATGRCRRALLHPLRRQALSRGRVLQG